MQIHRETLLGALRLAFEAADPPPPDSQTALWSPFADVRYSGGIMPCLEAQSAHAGVRLPLLDGLTADDAPGMIRRTVLDVLRACSHVETVDVDGWTAPAPEVHGPPEADGTPPRGAPPLRLGVQIRAGRFEAELYGSGGDAPDLPYGGEVVATFPAAAFKEAARAVAACTFTSGATGAESWRYCATIEAEADGTAGIVASDGHRLAVSGPVGVSPAGAPACRVAVHRNALALAVRAAAYTGAAEVEVLAPEEEGGPAVLRCGDVEVYAVGEVGALPFDWRARLAASGQPTRVEVAQSELAAAVRRVRTVLDGRNAYVWIVASETAGLRLVADDGSGMGRAIVPIPGARVQGPAVRLSACARYLADAVRLTKPGPCAVRMGGTYAASEPVEIEDRAGSVQYVMPCTPKTAPPPSTEIPGLPASPAAECVAA